MAFKDDLKTGIEYEEEVRELLEILMDKKFRRVTKEGDPTYYRYFDIIEKTRGKENLADCITAECKFTKQDSPNVIVEYTAYGRPSGIATSLAKYFVFNTPKFHIIVERAELIGAITNDLLHSDGYRKIKMKEYDNKQILLVPIALILSNCQSAMKQLRVPVLLGAREEQKDVQLEEKKSARKRASRKPSE